MDDIVALKIRGVLGALAILLLAFLLSTNRRAIKPRIVVLGLLLQVAFAFVVLRTAGGRAFFQGCNEVITDLLAFSQHGANFIFGGLAPAPGQENRFGFIFAFQVLTTIIFFASLMSVLYHLGVMQLVVKGVAWVMQRTLRTSGAETLSAAANIFVGQTEAPLLIKPFIARMTRSEIMAVMTGGFATVAGGVMAAYVAMLIGVLPDIAGHLMAASVMAAPTGLVLAKIMLPETETPETAGTVGVQVEKTTANVIDAAATGASDGLKLALNVGAMLLAFVALLAMIDAILGWCGGLFGYPEASLTLLFRWAFAPLAYAMGIESADVFAVGQLLGEKLVLTEFIAYENMAGMQGELSQRSITICSYALCGFANFASIAIQIGGIGAMAPERRAELARIGPRAMFAGFLTTCLTATVAGVIL